jgi:hypothetical protein
MRPLVPENSNDSKGRILLKNSVLRGAEFKRRGIAVDYYIKESYEDLIGGS